MAYIFSPLLSIPVIIITKSNSLRSPVFVLVTLTQEDKQHSLEIKSTPTEDNNQYERLNTHNINMIKAQPKLPIQNAFLQKNYLHGKERF